MALNVYQNKIGKLWYHSLSQVVKHKLALNDSAGFYNMQDFIKGVEKIIDSNKNTRITLYTTSVV